MKYIIPEKMKAVQIEKETAKLVVREVPVPRPGKGEVLVKVAAAPINPSDINQIKSKIEANNLDSYIPGIEGSGRIVAAGTGFLPSLFMGRRVGFTTGYGNCGTYAEYAVTKATLCFPLPEEVSDDQGSMLLVNPMTALAFFDIAKKGMHKSIISTAAAGALGRMIEYLGTKNGIPVINVVHKREQAEGLKKSGSKYILNSSDPEFSSQLKFMAAQLNASLVLDAVGGKGSADLLRALPYGGAHIIYGTLSGEPPEINSRLLIGENITLSGFYLANWSKDNGLLKTIRNVMKVRKLLKKDIQINIQSRFKLEEAQKAMDTYRGNMTAGKVLLVPPSNQELGKVE
jgi:NADPH:quinone reductase-like Zn-dependent oxidoreductase